MSIRLFALFTATVLCASFAATASDGGRQHFGKAGSGCSVDSNYTLRVDASGVRLDAEGQGVSPRRIRISDGNLQVDGVAKDVSTADARRLRDMESATRDMLPEIAGITREAMQITFDALAGVNEALSGNRRQAREFDRLRNRTLARIDATLGSGVWSPDMFGDAFEAEIESAAEAMAANFTPKRVIWMMMTGGIGRMERRVEKMEAGLERSIAAREGVLERHATALCGRLDAIDAMQREMEFRLDDGRPLRVFEIGPRSTPADGALQALR
ncbi:MAG: YggN family protein [Luteimonas sp.]|nr:YggN family protein [Luteimonas sp.]